MAAQEFYARIGSAFKLFKCERLPSFCNNFENFTDRFKQFQGGRVHPNPLVVPPLNKKSINKNNDNTTKERETIKDDKYSVQYSIQQ